MTSVLSGVPRPWSYSAFWGAPCSKADITPFPILPLEQMQPASVFSSAAVGQRDSPASSSRDNHEATGHDLFNGSSGSSSRASCWTQALSWRGWRMNEQAGPKRQQPCTPSCTPAPTLLTTEAFFKSPFVSPLGCLKSWDAHSWLSVSSSSTVLDAPRPAFGKGEHDQGCKVLEPPRKT